MYDPKHVFGIFGNFSCVAENIFRPFHFIHLQNNRETSTDLSPIPLLVYRLQLYSCLFIAYTVVCLSPIPLFRVLLHYVLFMSKYQNNRRTDLSFIKVALGVCFALKSWKEYFLLFTYLITLSKDVTFPLNTKFKTNKYLSYLSINRIPN